MRDRDFDGRRALKRRPNALVMCALASLATTMAAACSVPNEAGFPEVAHDVEARSGQRIIWNQDGEADAKVRAAVDEMLKRPLGPGETVQIALLNNPLLQAKYEELLVAQADVVQAGLLENPVFTGEVHLPVSGPTTLPHVQVGVEEDFLSILMIPAKRRIAKAEFEAAKRRVGSAVLDLAFEVRTATFTLESAMQVAALRRSILEAAQASVDLAEQQHAAGNISDLDFVNERVLSEQVRVDLSRSEAEIVAARERLTRLMGLWGLAAGFRVQERLPDVPPQELAVEHLETAAIRQRLDVASARDELEASIHKLEMATDFRWVSSLGFGVEYERDIQGGNEVGPAMSLSLPIFDQKQATLAKLAASVRQSERRYHAVAIGARSEVREARARVSHARSLVEQYRRVVIPLRERAVELSQVQYGAMLLGVYPLLQAKQAEMNAYREYIEAVRDYWIAEASLGHAVGGRLPPPPAAAKEPVSPTPDAAARAHGEAP